jgi:alkaline phosphatase
MIYGRLSPCISDVDWFALGKETIEELRQPVNNNGRAKNIILFIGDGMGISTVTAARLYKGELANRKGPEENLVFEDFPHSALSKVESIAHKIVS